MKNYFDLTGRVALVTGASSGLGVQFAKALASQGAHLALVARRKDRLDALAAELHALGVEAEGFACNIVKPEEIADTVKAVHARFGRIDILVNNAGRSMDVPAEDITDKQWKIMMDLNLNGPFFLSREVGRIMIAQQYGRIVNIGSVHSLMPSKGMYSVSAYCASKGGLLTLTKALAVEWAKHNINVNAIGPAYFETEMTEADFHDEKFINFVKANTALERTGLPGELDAALLYFASDACSYTTGQILYVDGGWTVL